MSDTELSELDPSELGTKEHWISTYTKEKENFENHGDVGEIWFGGDIVDRILKWFERNVSKESNVCDLGCGNGMFLVEAAHRGYTNLVGFDYCREAIELAEAISKTNGLKLEYRVIDLIGEVACDDVYDVLIDKGTYDAISLNPNNSKGSRHKYITNVAKLLSDEGIFILTSCNWTENELTLQFDGIFIINDVIPTPTFKFGGKEGSLVSCIVFKKKKM